MLEVLAPGLSTTVQDGGRPDAAPLGVPRSGACDPRALAAANLLLGNAPDAAGLEMTLVGPELVVRAPCVVALAGADLGAVVPQDGRRLRPGTSHLVRAGATIAFGAARDGARGYLALPGGIAVPAVLGSRSMASVGGFGGTEGRALAVGDLVHAADPGSLDRGGRSWPGPGRTSGVWGHVGPRTLRVVPGPHTHAIPGGSREAAWEALLATTWTVAAASDRMGLRLDGPAMPEAPGPEAVSAGMVWGAVQVPAGGTPIVLLVDGPTVGGYRVPAVVVSVDRPVLGQLRAGDAVRFEPVTLPDARRLAADAATDLRTAASRLRMAEPIG